MYDKYLVTGATGFLGRAVAEELVRRKAQVHALVLHDDPYINLLPKEVHTVIGDVCAENSLTDFFADADGRTCVIHCAGIVSVASRPRFEALSGQCRGDMESSPAMYGA